MHHFRILLPALDLLKLKPMFGILDNSKIEKVIKENVIGRLGCYGDGKMYILPISYAYDGKYIICT